MNVQRPDPWMAWSKYLDGLTWAEGKTKQRQTYRAFLRAGTLGIEPARALGEVARRVQDAGGRVVERDLRRNQSRAYGYAVKSEGSQPPPLPRVSFNLPDLEALARYSPTLTWEDVMAKSPVDPTHFTSGDFLEAIFRPGECVVICDSRCDRGRVYRVGSRAAWVNGLESPEGVFYLSNPVDGRLRRNSENKMSLRSETNLTDFRHLVIESDEAEALVWIRAMAQVSLPIAAIYSSAGKSIHLLTRWESPSKAAFEEIVAKLKPGLVRYGADEAAMTAVRLTRLPGAKRNGADQKLFFLDPKAEAVRLAVRPARGEA